MSFGSTATVSGIPDGVRPFLNRHCPMSAVARWLAIGYGSFQTKVVLSPRVRCDSRRPLAITDRSFGTVIRNVYEALSLGWSLHGNQVEEALGSSPMNAPSSVCTKPYGEPNTIGEPTIVCGTPPYATETANREFLRWPCRGVMISSWPSRRKPAGCPSTVTLCTVSCCRSRSNRDRSWVARAVIVTTPSSRPDAGSKPRSRS
jgi:hypothetical protein